jgi:hypothetical protein
VGCCPTGPALTKAGFSDSPPDPLEPIAKSSPGKHQEPRKSAAPRAVNVALARLEGVPGTIRRLTSLAEGIRAEHQLGDVGEVQWHSESFLSPFLVKVVDDGQVVRTKTLVFGGTRIHCDTQNI